MSKILFISDIHGNIKKLSNIIESNIKDYDKIVQVGDLYLGIPGVEIPEYDKKFGFIFGNHDCRSMCRNHLNYLGDFGYNPKLNLFWIGGAQTPLHERNNLTEDIDWWPNEQFSKEEWIDIIDLWTRTRPKIVVSHECPSFVRKISLKINETNLTAEMLSLLMRMHSPEYWVFGHHHKNINRLIDKTRFISKPLFDTFELDTNSDSYKFGWYK